MDPLRVNVTVRTAMHEVLHGLGFSAWHMAYFRDHDGQPLTPRDESGNPSTQSAVVSCSGGTYSFPMPSQSVVKPFLERGCVVWDRVEAAKAFLSCVRWQVDFLEGGPPNAGERWQGPFWVRRLGGGRAR